MNWLGYSSNLGFLKPVVLSDFKANFSVATSFGDDLAKCDSNQLQAVVLFMRQRMKHFDGTIGAGASGGSL